MSVGVRQSRARGQHFLRGSALAASIVRAAGVRPGDLVVDVGAGTGVLTSALVAAGADVIAVELDPQLAAGLRRRFPRVIEGDARHVPLPRRPFKVVANLPFDSGTAILRRLLDPGVALVSADVVLQWEVAAKRAAVWPSTRVGIEWSAWFELEVVRRLPRCCFAPPPDADAAVLKATRRSEPLVALRDIATYRRFLDSGFRAGVRAVVPPRELKRAATELGFDRAAQPRDLDAVQWAELFRRASVRRPR